MTSPKVLLLLVLISVCIAGLAQSANLITNGDFEDLDGWGALGSEEYPAGWTNWVSGAHNPNTEGSPGNMAVQQSGSYAIGGSGTSAYIPSDPDAQGWRALLQPITDAPTAWQFEMDFATVDPQATRSMTLNLGCNYNTDTKTIIMRIVQGSELGYCTLEIYKSGWKTFGDLENSIIADDDVTETPLMHHLKVVGDYSLATPSYSVYLTDSNGVEHSAANLSAYIGTAVAQGNTLNIVRFVQYNHHPSILGYDYLIDNVYLGAVGDDYFPGDANRDGKVDATDAARLAACWLQSGNWSTGDFNNDGIVNDKDAALMAANWGYGVTAASVPEPASVVLLSILLVSLLVWRRRS